MFIPLVGHNISGPFPLALGKLKILGVVVDYFTKHVKGEACKNQNH